MSFYRRFISYMYESYGEAKNKNCGFVKVEIRGPRLNLFFQLKNAPCQEKCNVYLCQRDAAPEYIFLKTLPIKDGYINYKIETSSQNIGGSSTHVSQCCGILCTDEEGNVCSTCWDNKGRLPEYRRTEAIKEEPLDTIDSVEEDSNIAEEVPIIPEEPVGNDIKDCDSCDIEESNPTSDPQNDTPIPPTTFPQLWEYLQKEFSPMDPFEDNAIVETIKISPSDLGYLQSYNLNLGSNQFLLHGYKSYHHLILGRMHGQNQYILGIPGIYDPQEQFMAKMFGFPCFKPIRECRQKNGQFGYWMRCFR